MECILKWNPINIKNVRAEVKPDSHKIALKRRFLSKQNPLKERNSDQYNLNKWKLKKINQSIKGQKTRETKIEILNKKSICVRNKNRGSAKYRKQENQNITTNQSNKAIEEGEEEEEEGEEEE